VLLNGEKIGKIKHRPQLLKTKPFVFETAKLTDKEFSVRTVDENGDRSYLQPKGTTININSSY